MRIPFTETKEVEAGTIDIGEFKWDSEKGPKGKMPYALLRVFVNDGTRPGMSNIIADFVWRREVSYTELAKNATLHKALAKLVRATDENTKLSFSRHAGCGLCPCSPGLILTHNDKLQNGKSSYIVWITLNHN